MNIIPLNNKLLILPKPPEKMKGQIYIPDSVQEKEKPMEGKIIAVADDIENKYVNVDDYVLYPRHSGYEICLNKTNYLLIDSDEIICKLSEAPSPIAVD